MVPPIEPGAADVAVAVFRAQRVVDRPEGKFTVLGRQQDAVFVVLPTDFQSGLPIEHPAHVRDLEAARFVVPEGNIDRPDNRAPESGSGGAPRTAGGVALDDLILLYPALDGKTFGGQDQHIAILGIAQGGSRPSS